MSSSWKQVHPFAELGGFLSPDLQHRVVGCTPDLGRFHSQSADAWTQSEHARSRPIYTREAEIRRWLLDSGTPQRQWVALDDMPELFRPGCAELVVCRGDVGLTQLALRSVDRVLLLMDSSARRTRLTVSNDTADLARRFGAKFDARSQTWYVEGEVPVELTNLVYVEPTTTIWKPQGPVPAIEVLASLAGPPEANPKAADLNKERILRLAIEHHKGRVNDAAKWLVTKKVSLGQRAPMDVLATEAGCLAVEDMLRRLWD